MQVFIIVSISNRYYHGTGRKLLWGMGCWVWVVSQRRVNAAPVGIHHFRLFVSTCGPCRCCGAFNIPNRSAVIPSDGFPWKFGGRVGFDFWFGVVVVRSAGTHTVRFIVVVREWWAGAKMSGWLEGRPMGKQGAVVISHGWVGIRRRHWSGRRASFGTTNSGIK